MLSAMHAMHMRSCSCLCDVFTVLHTVHYVLRSSWLREPTCTQKSTLSHIGEHTSCADFVCIFAPWLLCFSRLILRLPHHPRCLMLIVVLMLCALRLSDGIPYMCMHGTRQLLCNTRAEDFLCHPNGRRTATVAVAGPCPWLSVVHGFPPSFSQATRGPKRPGGLTNNKIPPQA